MSIQEPQFDALVGSIYDGVMAPTGFQHFIEQLVDVFALKAAMLFTGNLETGESKGLWVTGMGMDWVGKYALDYAGQDMLAQHVHTAPLALFYASNLDLDASAFMDSRFYREWVVPQRIGCASAALVLREGPWCSQVVLQRRIDQPPFTRDEMASCNRLIPHLQRAVQMRQRFGERMRDDGMPTTALDTMAMPSLLIDEFGRVAYANPAAHTLIAGSDYLQIDAGHLRVNRPGLTHQLNLEIMAAVHASRGDSAHAPGLVVIRRTGLRPLILMLSPLRVAQAGTIKGGAILFVYDAQSTPATTVGLIERLFALTEAEAQLAVALCAGRTLEEAATQRGTSVHTVRSQLKSLFNKTGTSRQADLIVLLLSSPAYFLSAVR